MLTHLTGVTRRARARATPGYVLIAPSGGTAVYLVTYDGDIANTWIVGGGLSFWCELLPNGNLFANERAEVRKGVQPTGSGLMREYDRDSALVW